jgi:CRISPR-associated protein Cmr5
MPKLREQDRAIHAYKSVNSWIEKKGSNERANKEYRQELQQLPSLILTSGLGQTLAFYCSKKDFHSEIADQLTRHLTNDKCKSAKDFLKQIMEGSAKEYRLMTREALAYAEWLKRYSKALIQDSDKGGKNA